ncbi:MAG: glutamate--cysteine ligase [Leptospiraceae bacterium]|nr:glutamate--cysteine ligase [Leptospiraceae bacterium]MCB1315082.1 glutamate--cysteine ligase [Leptospiraceae bacterium]
MPVYRNLNERIREAGARILTRGSLHGLERECLRITSNGQLARTAHPTGLGSSLTHPYITTDFAEPQLEYTTAPHRTIFGVTRELRHLQMFTCHQLGQEILWPLSMPPALPSDAEIPIAQYGNSENGLKKTIYREGLANRYGPRMQTISGVHYNFSPGDEFFRFVLESLTPTERDSVGPTAIRAVRDRMYMGTIRNFHRHAYFLPFLFGASSVIDDSFLTAPDNRLSRMRRRTLYGPYATSLRLSDIGYTNREQWELNILYNNLKDYLSAMWRAVSTSNPEFERITKEGGRQLNSNYLQIENEHYSAIRPKQNLGPGERPLTALADRGIRYLEVRALDLNPFTASGIDRERLAFTHLLLLHCLIQESPPLSAQEMIHYHHLQTKVIWEGRNPDLQLEVLGRHTRFHDLGMQLCDRMSGLAELLDRERPDNMYTQSLIHQRRSFEDPTRTPSARLLNEVGGSEVDYIDYGLELALRYRAELCAGTLTPRMQRKLDRVTQQSILDFERLESSAV